MTDPLGERDLANTTLLASMSAEGMGPCVGGYGQILVTAVTAVMEDEYGGLEGPYLGSETFLQQVSVVVRDARERRMFV
jgi:hypothetical protein